MLTLMTFRKSKTESSPEVEYGSLLNRPLQATFPLSIILQVISDAPKRREAMLGNTDASHKADYLRDSAFGKNGPKCTGDVLSSG